MKKLRFIFVFIFLSGMLFTVFQYLPILEEETPSHRVEIVKKAKQGDLGDGDADSNDEDCDDDDSEQDAASFFSTSYNTFYSNKSLHFSTGNNLYKYLLEHKDTPPPKV